MELNPVLEYYDLLYFAYGFWTLGQYNSNMTLRVASAASIALLTQIAPTLNLGVYPM